MSACPALSVTPQAAVVPHLRLRRLAALDGEQIAAHLCALDSEARRALFAAPLSDQAIADYVSRLDYRRDLCIGAFSPQRALVGLLQLRLAGRRAQLAASVDAGWRQRGVGRALLARGLRMSHALGARQWALASRLEFDPVTELATDLTTDSANELASELATKPASHPAADDRAESVIDSVADEVSDCAAHLPLRRICHALGYPVVADASPARSSAA